MLWRKIVCLYALFFLFWKKKFHTFIHLGCMNLRLYVIVFNSDFVLLCICLQCWYAEKWKISCERKEECQTCMTNSSLFENKICSFTGTNYHNQFRFHWCCFEFKTHVKRNERLLVVLHFCQWGRTSLHFLQLSSYKCFKICCFLCLWLYPFFFFKDI